METGCQTRITARRYRVRICLFIYLSNHCHLLVLPADARQLARFMGFVNGLRNSVLSAVQA